MRKVLEDLAISRHMDPLNPETWYKTSRKILQQQNVYSTQILFISIYSQIARAALFYRGGYTKLVERVFPELSFDSGQFNTAPSKYK